MANTGTSETLSRGMLTVACMPGSTFSGASMSAVTVYVATEPVEAETRFMWSISVSNVNPSGITVTEQAWPTDILSMSYSSTLMVTRRLSRSPTVISVICGQTASPAATLSSVTVPSMVERMVSPFARRRRSSPSPTRWSASTYTSCTLVLCEAENVSESRRSMEPLKLIEVSISPVSTVYCAYTGTLSADTSGRSASQPTTHAAATKTRQVRRTVRRFQVFPLRFAISCPPLAIFVARQTKAKLKEAVNEP